MSITKRLNAVMMASLLFIACYDEPAIQQSVISIRETTGPILYQVERNPAKEQWEGTFVSGNTTLLTFTDPQHIQKMSDRVYYLSSVGEGEFLDYRIWRIDFNMKRAEVLLHDALLYVVDPQERYLAFLETQVSEKTKRPTGFQVVILDLKSRKVVRSFSPKGYQEFMRLEKIEPMISYNQSKSRFEFSLLTEDYHVAKCFIDAETLSFHEESRSQDTFSPP